MFGSSKTVCIFVLRYINTKILKQMQVSIKITDKLLSDRKFRLQTADALEVSERNVENLAKSRSSNLTKLAAVMVYKKYGFKQSEILVESDAD